VKKKENKAGKKTKALATQEPATDGALTLYSKDVANLLHKKTPKEFIEKHPYNGLDYVQIGYVRRCVEDFCAKLDATWSFEVEEPGAIDSLLKAKHIVVKGRLVIVMKDGTPMVRENYGGSDVKFFKDTHRTKPGLPMDLGNDYKAAASDAFKKCASSFGIAQDVYEPKVERKVEAMTPARVAELVQGRVVDSTTGIRTNGDVEAPARSQDFTNPERISAAAMSVAAKLLHKSALENDAQAFMKQTFGHTLMTKMTMGQYNELMSWADKQGYIPF